MPSVLELSNVLLVLLLTSRCAPAPTPPPTPPTRAEAEEAATTTRATSPPAGPTVHFGDVLMHGAPAPDGLRHALERQLEGFQDCYAAGLERDGSIAGTMTLTFKVDHDGLIAKAGVGNWGDVVGDVDLQRCVIEHTLAGSYPGPDDGEANVSFELRFAP